jgi:HSP20 family protein
MAIVRWDPLGDVATLQDRINRLFTESFGRPSETDEEMRLCAWRPSVDIYEAQQGIVLVAELPGLTKEDVSVEIKNNILTIRGERRAQPEIEAENYYRRERCFGTFQRSFPLEGRIEPNLIKANFRDGLLKIEIPHPEEDKPKQVTVTVD